MASKSPTKAAPPWHDSIMNSLDIRPMARRDIDVALEWAAAEGWNPGLADADAFLGTDPEGFLMAWHGQERAACISVVAYGDAYGFLGFYIAAPAFRGRGFGWATWQAGMARLGGRVVGLDGVVAQQDNYRKSGFALAHRNVRYEGLSRADMPADPRLARIGQGILPSIVAYDRAFFAAPRDAFVARTADFVHETGGVILQQLRAIGASADWRRTAYTLSPETPRFCSVPWRRR